MNNFYLKYFLLKSVIFAKFSDKVNFLILVHYNISYMAVFWAPQHHFAGGGGLIDICVHWLFGRKINSEQFLTYPNVKVSYGITLKRTLHSPFQVQGCHRLKLWVKIPIKVYEVRVTLRWFSWSVCRYQKWCFIGLERSCVQGCLVWTRRSCS